MKKLRVCTIVIAFGLSGRLVLVGVETRWLVFAAAGGWETHSCSPAHYSPILAHSAVNTSKVTFYQQRNSVPCKMVFLCDHSFSLAMTMKQTSSSCHVNR